MARTTAKDQLRMIKVKGTAKLFPPEEDRELSILAQFADYLSPEVRAITVGDDGLLTRISIDPEEDGTLFLVYPHFSLCGSLADCRTIQYSELQELDRLTPFINLSSYEDEDRSGIPQRLFKFNILNKPLRLQMAWDGLNIIKSLPPKPNIIPFHSLVLNEESRVIGFTTKYIVGGTLANPKIPLRFEWLQELTHVMDFLNLELGIMHQDIAPRNILIDPYKHKIVLFDFDRAASGKNLYDCLDDITSIVFPLYELITNDKSLRYILLSYPFLGSKYRYCAKYLRVE